MTRALFESHLHSLPLIARGKVRDNYAVGADRILMVASDRISAFDVVMGEPIPGKGETLTRMALFWFHKLAHVVPNHLTGVAPESVVAPDEVEQVRGRSMLVKRLKPLPIEAVVRGYLAGSGWKEYQQQESVCGIRLPAGLRQAARLPEPIFTPATKAEAGAHDENISFAQTQELIGPQLAEQVRRIAIQLYQEAAAYAMTRGVVIADTKFEFGLDEHGVLTLMDEVLTPDSSRFWPIDSYRVGESPPSYDKQYLRDWLEEVRIDGRPWNKRTPAPNLSPKVVENTRSRYAEALARIAGRGEQVMTSDLLVRLESLSKSASSDTERWIYRAQLACALARLGHIDTARAEIKSLRARNSAYGPRLTAWILLAEGLVGHYESLSTDAADRFKRAYGLGVALGDNEVRSMAAAWMAASEFLMAHYETAVQLAVEAIQYAPEEEALALSRAHLVLANTLNIVGAGPRAAKHYREARRFAVEARDISMQSAILYNVAAFRVTRMSLEDAFGESTDEEFAIAELELNSISNLDSGLGVDSLRAMVPLLRAQLLLTRKEWANANALYAASIPEASSHGQLRETPKFLAEQAHCQAMLGHPEHAVSLASIATTQITSRTDADDLAACYARLSLCFSALGFEEKAMAHFELALKCRTEFVAFQSEVKAKVLAIQGEA